MALDVTAPNLSPQVGQLYGQIVDSERRLRNLVQEMSPEALRYKGPTGRDNSPLALLAHLALANLNMIERYTGRAVPAEWKQAWGPARDEADRLPEPQGVTAADLLERIDRASALLGEVLAAWSDRDLDRQLTMRDGTVVTVRWGLWHIGEHCMMHQGQIRVLQRQFREQG